MSGEAHSHRAVPWSLPSAGSAPEISVERNVLRGRIRADVCVIGAGIAGISTAFQLARSGVSVVLIDAGTLGGGETQRSSAHLASALDDRFSVLERVHGRDGARLAATSHATAIDCIESLTQQENIACDFRRLPGYLFAADPAGNDVLNVELPAARRAGLDVTDVAQLEGAGAGGLRVGRCVRFAQQAAIDPLRYLAGLLQAAERIGVQAYGRTRATTISGGGDAHVATDTGAHIACGAIVVCTNVPINDRIALQTSLEAYRSYVITMTVPCGAVEDALYWDTADPYHYVRVISGAEEDLLVVGGEDHKTGQGPEDAEQPYQRLEAWIRQLTPACGSVVHRWSGQIIEPIDGLALIGRNTFDADNVYVIAGDSGNGLTHGTLGGMIISDQIQGIANPWEGLYRPSRMRLRSTGEFAKHNVNVLGQYTDWLQPAEAAAVDAVGAGQAALIREGLSKWAVARDLDGTLHVCSAVCPHLGGLVRWNAGERTWDCPCHGSRFTVDGEVVNGPANTGLAPVTRHGDSGSLQPVIAL